MCQASHSCCSPGKGIVSISAWVLYCPQCRPFRVATKGRSKEDENRQLDRLRIRTKLQKIKSELFPNKSVNRTQKNLEVLRENSQGNWPAICATDQIVYLLARVLITCIVYQVGTTNSALPGVLAVSTGPMAQVCSAGLLLKFC